MLRHHVMMAQPLLKLKTGDSAVDQSLVDRRKAHAAPFQIGVILFVLVAFFSVTIAHACIVEHHPADAQWTNRLLSAIQSTAGAQTREDQCIAVRERMLSREPSQSETHSAVPRPELCPLTWLEVPSQTPIVTALESRAVGFIAARPIPLFVFYSIFRI